MKLPSRLSIALGTLVGGLITLSTELAMAHPLHVACVLVGGFVLFMLHPEEPGAVTTPQSARKPDGAIAAPPGV